MENEFKKMQKIAGLITENQNSTSSKKIRFEDMVDLVVDSLNADLEDIEHEKLTSKEEIDEISSIDDLIVLVIDVTGLDEEEAYEFIIKSMIE